MLSQVALNGNTFGSATAITPGSSQAIVGTTITVQFASGIGHTAGARWIITTVGTTITLTSSPSIREHILCSGWGLCDTTQGLCTCKGPTQGSACQYLSSELTSTQNGPVWTVTDWTVSARVLQQVAALFVVAAAVAAGHHCVTDGKWLAVELQQCHVQD